MIAEKSKYPDATYLDGVDSNKKRVSVDRWIRYTIKRWAKTRNKKMTQGVLTYELLLFNYDELNDEIDEMESMLNEELSEYNVPIDELDSLSWTDEASVMENLIGEFSESNEDGDSTDSVKMRLWLPERVLSDCPWERGWGDRIETAILRTYASVFTDRLDRIAIKRQLNDYLRSGVEPTTHVARVITGNDDSEEIDVSDDLRAAFTASVTSPFEYEQKANAGELTQWSERFDALAELVNSAGPTHRDALVRTVEEAHDISSPGYIEDKVDEFIDEYWDQLDGLTGVDRGQDETEDDVGDSDESEEKADEFIAEHGTGEWSDFDAYSEITQTEVKGGLLRQYLNHIESEDETVTVEDIEYAMELADWDTPPEFDSVEGWVESFSNVIGIHNSKLMINNLG